MLRDDVRNTYLFCVDLNSALRHFNRLVAIADVQPEVPVCCRPSPNDSINGEFAEAGIADSNVVRARDSTDPRYIGQRHLSSG